MSSQASAGQSVVTFEGARANESSERTRGRYPETIRRAASERDRRECGKNLGDFRRVRIYHRHRTDKGVEEAQNKSRGNVPRWKLAPRHAMIDIRGGWPLVGRDRARSRLFNPPTLDDCPLASGESLRQAPAKWRIKSPRCFRSVRPSKA
ncbi:hypothetical protein KM043_003039 [Ampulex compressa]|nr:hypothetical protein KM043_003039 [Ampulex compressa]